MKKHLIIFIFLTLLAPAFAVDYGVLDDTAEQTGTGKKARWYTKGLINKIVPSAPQITYCIDGDLQVYSETEYAPKIKEAFNEWFFNTVHYINKSGRRELFEKILPYLEKPPVMKKIVCPCIFTDDKQMGKFVSQGTGSWDYACIKDAAIPDLYFILGAPGTAAVSSGSASTAGTHRYHRDKNMHEIVVDVSGDLHRVLIHEIGHALGLGDQYEEALHNSLPETLVLDTLPSVMDNALEAQCDDAEGIINLIDCFRAPPAEQYFRGGDKGWKSICEGRNITYVECQAKGRTQNLVYGKPGDSDVRIHLYDKKTGKLKNTTIYNDALSVVFPYNIYEKRSYSKETRDEQGRLKYLKDKDGVETFFEYYPRGYRYYSLQPKPKNGYGDHKESVIGDTFVYYDDKGDLRISNKAKYSTAEITVEVFKSGTTSAARNFYIDKDLTSKTIASVSSKGNWMYIDHFAEFNESPADGYAILSLGSDTEDKRTGYICLWRGQYAVCRVVEYFSDYAQANIRKGTHQVFVEEIFSTVGVDIEEGLKQSAQNPAAEELKELLERVEHAEGTIRFSQYFGLMSDIKNYKTAGLLNQNSAEDNRDVLKRVLLNKQTRGERKETLKVRKEIAAISKKLAKQQASIGFDGAE